MDWGKTKNILIVALALTNLLLIGIYGYQYKSDQHKDDELFVYAVSLLEKNNIYIDNTEIPERAGKMSSLTVAYDKIDNKSVKSRILEGEFGQPLSSLEDEIIKYCNKILTESNLKNEYVVFEGIKTEGTKTSVIYKNYYEDVAVEECEMKFVFENGNIKEFDRKWIDVVEEGNTKMDTIPPISALLIFQNMISKQSPVYIESVKIVYLLESYDINGEMPILDTAFPAWQIIYDKNQIIYIPAFEH